MIKKYCKKHQNNKCLQQISKERLEFTSELWVFLLFLQGLAPSWQLAFCRLLCYPSLAELYYGLIDLDRYFKVVQVVKKEIPSKTMWILAFSSSFQINQIQNSSVEIRKVKDWTFSFQLKKEYFCWMLTDNARHENVPSPLYLTRILKSYHKRNDSNRFPEK